MQQDRLIRAWKQAIGTLITGGVHHDKTPGATEPYATIKVKPTDRENFSGNVYLQKYRVDLVVHMGESVGSAGTMQRQLEALFDGRTTLPQIVSPTRVIEIRQAESDPITEDDERREGRDSLPVPMAWDVTLQECRGK